MRSLNPSPGKFEGNRSQLLARVAYEASLDGCSEDIGDVDSLGWHASLTEGKRFVFIVTEDSLGFVDVAWYRKAEPAWSEDWENMVSAADAFFADSPEED